MYKGKEIASALYNEQRLPRADTGSANCTRSGEGDSSKQGPFKFALQECLKLGNGTIGDSSRLHRYLWTIEQVPQRLRCNCRFYVFRRYREEFVTNVSCGFCHALVLLHYTNESKDEGQNVESIEGLDNRSSHIVQILKLQRALHRSWCLRGRMFNGDKMDSCRSLFDSVVACCRCSMVNLVLALVKRKGFPEVGFTSLLGESGC